MDKKTKLLFVNKKGLINGLVATLNFLETDSVTHVYNERLLQDKNITLKCDDIFVGEKKVFHNESLTNDNAIGCYPKKNMITLASAFDLVEPLYGEFPYLEIIMNKVAMDMFLSDGEDISERMIDAAIWYQAYMPYTEDILMFRKTRKN